jgi:hypothetical protein
MGRRDQEIHKEREVFERELLLEKKLLEYIGPKRGAQAALAKKLELGRDHFNKMIHGERKMSFAILRAFCNALDLDPLRTQELFELAGFHLGSPQTVPSPLPKQEAAASHPDSLRAYLEQVIREYETLRLPLAEGDTPLERLYITLRADEMNRQEREAERLSLDEVTERSQRRGDNTDLYTHYAHIREQITRNPTMFMLDARHWPRSFGKREAGPINIAQVVQQYRQVVVLGDPGSGKTTVGKWLVLQHARAALAGLSSVTVPADNVQPGSKEHQPLDLGRTCLPIFLSMAALSTLDTAHLLDTIVRYDCASGKPPVLLSPALQALRHDALSKGEALVVLDGLDEVHNSVKRREIMLDIDHFLQGPPDALEQWRDNKVLLTSRIVGYHYAPLIDLPHHTVEGMDEQAITAFCQTWMQHVANVDAQAVEQQAQRLRNAIFDHAHPGVRALASNPLLLTILAQVYWKHPEHCLPTTRAALFKRATDAMFQQHQKAWEQSHISEELFEQALGQVAFDIHRETMLGLVLGGRVRKSLGAVLRDRGQKEKMLKVAHDVTGFLVEKDFLCQPLETTNFSERRKDEMNKGPDDFK